MRHSQCEFACLVPPKDPYRARVSDSERALVAYALKLTRTLARVEEADGKKLRDTGWDNRAILDAALVTAYFNFVNRLAEGLGVNLERPVPSPGTNLS